MKVKIMQRSVYHKYAEIEVEVPKDVDVQEWLMDNEVNWMRKVNGCICVMMGLVGIYNN